MDESKRATQHKRKRGNGSGEPRGTDSQKKGRWQFGTTRFREGSIWTQPHTDFVGDDPLYNKLVVVAPERGRTTYRFEGVFDTNMPGPGDTRPPVWNRPEFVIGFGGFCSSIHQWSCQQVRKKDKDRAPPQGAIFIDRTKWPGEEVWNTWAWAPLDKVPICLGTTVKVADATAAFGDGTILDVFLKYGVESKRFVLKHMVRPFQDKADRERARMQTCARRTDMDKPCTGHGTCTDFVFDVYRFACAPGAAKAARVKFPYVDEILKPSIQ